MPRFVLLRHDCLPSYKPSHWDFMLERHEALLTWSLAALPRSWAAALAVEGDADDAVEAVKLADHRIAYLDYEGPVSDDRGKVRRCDGGEFRWVEHGDQALSVELHGAALQDVVRLRQLDGDRWRLKVRAK